MPRALSVAVPLIVVTLNGCGTFRHQKEVETTNQNALQEMTKTVADTRQDNAKKAAPVREINGVWLGGKTVKVQREVDLPAIFHRHITLQFTDTPSLSVLADRLSKITGLTVKIAPDMLVPPETFSSVGQNAAKASASTSPSDGGATSAAILSPMLSRRFVLDTANPFNGTLLEFLDRLAARSGAGWDYKEGAILLSRVVTRSYQLKFSPGKRDFSTSIQKTSSTGGGDNKSGAGTPEATSGVSASMAAKLDSWKSLEDAVKVMLSPIGKFAISQASGLLTVSDTREIQDQIRELVDAENRAMSRQVSLRVQIIQVETDRQSNFSLDWTWLLRNSAKWNFQVASPQIGRTTSDQDGYFFVSGKQGSNGGAALLQALSEVGKVNALSDMQYTTLSNKPIAVAFSNTEGFLAKITPSQGGSGANSAGSPGLEPGSLTTGLFMTILPSVQSNGSVLLEFSYDKSVNKGFKFIGSIALNSSESNSGGGRGLQIQVPTIVATQFNQNATVPNSATLVLSGIDLRDEVGNEKSFDASLSPLLGGGVNAAGVRKSVLVLLTPTVIEGAI